MRRNKILILLLTLVLAFSAGCGNAGEGAVPDDESPVVTSLIHGNPTGVWLMLSTGIAESVNKFYPGSIVEENT